MNTENLCPCGSKKIFEKCCGRFLSGVERAPTPEQLMRSRYSAHVLLGQGKPEYGDYLVSTWLAAVELGLTAEAFAGHRVNWQKLEVLYTSQQGDEGEVEFKAYFYADTSSSGDMQVHHEHSVFKRIKGIWYYIEAKEVEAKVS